MKRGILFFWMLLLSGCAYRNPLDKADFRFETVMVPPYVLSSWYRISSPGEPLTVYVEGYETPPTETVRRLTVQDEGQNVAYIGRACQYFKTAVCSKELSPAESDKIVQKGIQQLQKKAKTEKVDVKGLK